jgi:hypothetical protein
MTLEDLENKFNALSANLLSADRQNKIKDIIFNCDTLSTKEFMKELII